MKIRWGELDTDKTIQYDEWSDTELYQNFSTGLYTVRHGNEFVRFKTIGYAIDCYEKMIRDVVPEQWEYSRSYGGLL